MSILSAVQRLSIACLFAAAQGTALGQNQSDNLKGPAFSDPDQAVVKPDDWIARPLRYTEWAEHADVAIMIAQSFRFLIDTVKEYAQANGIDVAIREGRCGNSKRMLEEKAIDIGGWCCPPAVSDRLPGLRFHTLAIDALGIIVHKDNPVDDLSVDQVREIFQGKITNWSRVYSAGSIPGPDLPIRPVIRLHCKLRPGHWRLILDDGNMFSTQADDSGTVPDMVINGVAQYGGSIGYETVANIELSKASRDVKVVRVNGVSPYDHDALAAGSYPFYRVHNLTTWDSRSDVNPKAKALVSHLVERLGEAGLAGNPYHVVPARYLRQAGWKFRDDELIGEPD